MPSVERTTSAVVRLVRLHNGVIAALGVLVGAWWAAGRIDGRRTLLAALAAVLLASFANAFNDLCDLEIDRVAHPGRPLPRGELSLTQARRIAIAAALLALFVSGFAWTSLVIVSAAVLVAMTIYSLRLKRLGVRGNFLVAILASLPFLYGAWSVGSPEAAGLLMAIGVPLHFARELAKDLDDREGDLAVRRTLPISHGAGWTRKEVALWTLVALFPMVQLMVEHHVFAALVTPAVLLCIGAASRVARGRTGGPVLFKTAMVWAMLSLLVTRS